MRAELYAKEKKEKLMNTGSKKKSYEDLIAFTSEIFKAAGMSKKNGEIIADKLIAANLLGIDSHGILRLPIYLERILSGAMNCEPNVRVIKKNGGISLIDGDNAPGMLVGYRGMREAIQTAKEFQIGLCGAINSNHFGAAGIFARMAVEEGMIGICMTNVAPLMTVPGVPKAIIGNNPFAIAVPVRSGDPIVLDISLSNVALGKILLAEKMGGSIPDDWATDVDGIPTTDPAAAVKGYLLPIAGHKGFGLALIIDILCGVFTGGAFLHHLKGMYKYPKDPSVTAHLMMAIKIDALIEMEDFYKRIDEFKKILKETPSNCSEVTVKWPGEPESEISAKRRIEGITLQESFIDELNALASRVGASVRL